MKIVSSKRFVFFALVAGIGALATWKICAPQTKFGITKIERKSGVPVYMAKWDELKLSHLLVTDPPSELPKSYQQEAENYADSKCHVGSSVDFAVCSVYKRSNFVGDIDPRLLDFKKETKKLDFAMSPIWMEVQINRETWIVTLWANFCELEKVVEITAGIYQQMPGEPLYLGSKELFMELSNLRNSSKEQSGR